MLNIPVIDLKGTGLNITKLREMNHLSVKDLQEIFGFATPQAIYRWQHGTALPDEEFTLSGRICSVFYLQFIYCFRDRHIAYPFRRSM